MRISGSAWLFGTTMFVAALLLFSAQPMIGKMVLPILGGTPAAWDTCLGFYQSALLAGYGYPHLIPRSAGLRTQLAAHALLFGALVLVLPVAIPTRIEP